MKDFVDSLIKSINWKIGNFSFLPIAFGTVMALVDMCMMGGIKMVHNGTLPAVTGVIMSSAVYLLQPLIFLKAMNYQGMAVTNLVWNLISNTIVTLQGVFIFGESIKGLRWVAMAMGLVSLVLFAYSEDN
jgi:multidrug transporter EmrE-like cation transporter